jgi:2-hydroxy-3-oxopropionate reductase
VAEALALTRALHADTGRVAAAMAGGFAASQVLADLGPGAGGRADGGPGRTGPSVDEGAAALGAVLDDAHALGCALPLTALVAQQLNALAGAGLGQSDLAALGELLARMRAPETPA